ncbi:MAG: multicopper oxidase domain-containing protein [Chloroflexota bacterium]|nr:multicopper oxidase domain-containing protein [Chloroflexota bacterium]
MFPVHGEAVRLAHEQHARGLRDEVARYRLVRDIPVPRQDRRRGVSRRLALLAGAGLVLLVMMLVRPGGGSAPAVAEAPGQREFTLVAEEFDWEIMPGVVVRAWGYNRQLPGPEIRVREGDLVRVRLENKLPVGTTIHWHGMDVPPAMDGPVGLNQAAVEPGERFTYEFVASNTGSRWYHAHADPKYQIALGLYGPLIVEPAAGSTVYDREYTYMLNEWDLELTPDVAQGKAPLGPGDQLLRGGELGTDLFLINGRAHESIPPIKLAAGERVLIRLMNAGNLPHAVHSHGHSFKIVATDGNPVPPGMELTKDTVLIGPGERYDLELVGTNPGIWMFHCHMENHADNGMMTLIQYDDEMPTGPVAEFFDPDRGVTTGHMGHQPTAAGSKPDAAPPVTSEVPAAEPILTGDVIEVALLDDRFEAPDLTVTVGTTLRFVNRGANWHSVAAFDGSFASGRMEPGSSFEIRLDTLGEVRFLCQHHAMRGMVGRVMVTMVTAE